MKQSVRLVASLALSAGFVAGAAMAADITGAGATFPTPVCEVGHFLQGNNQQQYELPVHRLWWWHQADPVQDC
jgi:hypothetical protein